MYIFVQSKVPCMKTKILLEEEQMPKKWYNVQADLPSPMDPPLHPATHKPVVPDDLKAIFPMELIRQEVTTDRYIDIPEEVQEVLHLWRPSPLYRAHRLEKFLKTPAKIYYKWEGVSPAGSHKTNTSIPQAYYNMKAGMERIATETGAGQWGSALAFATKLYDLECTIYMVRSSYTQKPYRKSMMHVWGAEWSVSRAPVQRPIQEGQSWKRTRTPRVLWGSRSPRPLRMRPRMPTPTTRSVRC